MGGELIFRSVSDENNLHRAYVKVNYFMCFFEEFAVNIIGFRSFWLKIFFLS